MRVTQRAVAATSLQGLNRNLDQIGRLQQQLTSGRQISAPSDSPTGTNRAMQIRSSQAAVGQQSRALADARAWLQQTDSTLQTMVQHTQRVRDLALQASNDGALSATGRQAIAIEVASLREGLVALANTRSQGRPLFGGTTSGPAAYDADGTYVGTAGDINRRVSDDEVMAVNVTGPVAFGAGPDDLFSVVQAIATDATADPAALSGHLQALDDVMEGMLDALSSVGVRGTRVERLEQIGTDRALSLSSQLSEVENIDLPNTIMKLQMQQIGYETALAATAKAIQPTLLDFLR
ncbi:flagellar hook-associated protein FlgL [Geodermatophilus sp. SYSU D00710]